MTWRVDTLINWLLYKFWTCGPRTLLIVVSHRAIAEIHNSMHIVPSCMHITPHVYTSRCNNAHHATYMHIVPYACTLRSTSLHTSLHIHAHRSTCMHMVIEFRFTKFVFLSRLWYKRSGSLNCISQPALVQEAWFTKFAYLSRLWCKRSGSLNSHISAGGTRLTIQLLHHTVEERFNCVAIVSTVWQTQLSDTRYLNPY